MIWDNWWCLAQTESMMLRSHLSLLQFSWHVSLALIQPGQENIPEVPDSCVSWVISHPIHLPAAFEQMSSCWRECSVLILIYPFFAIFVGCYWTRQKKLINFSEILEIIIGIRNNQKSSWTAVVQHSGRRFPGCWQYSFPFRSLYPSKKTNVGIHYDRVRKLPFKHCLCRIK